MKNLWKKYNSYSLIIRISLGLLIGVLLGIFFPQLTFVSLFGTIFVGALKSIAPLLVFVLVISSIVNAKGSNISNRFSKVIGFYLFSTFSAAFVTVCLCFLFPVKMPLQNAVSESVSIAPPSGITEVFETLLSNIVVNPVSSIANANYIGILFWAILFAVALKNVAGESLATGFKQISDAVAKIVAWIISFAPFGVMGLVFNSVSSNGLGIFNEYGKIVALLLGCMAFIALVITPLIVGLTLRKNPYPLVLRCYKESGITAFFTRSSAANIPVNIALCEKINLDSSFYTVSLSLGSTINMNGAAVTITTMTMATAFALGIDVDFLSAIFLSFIATLGSCGASGVAGGSLLLIPMACSLFGIPADISMTVVGIGFIIGVIQDSVETAINSSTDVIYTATAELSERK